MGPRAGRRPYYNRGMPLFPTRIELKTYKCPKCGDGLSHPELFETEATLRVVCQKAACGYSIDLGWLGDAPNSN